jgi:hypothetical protein
MPNCLKQGLPSGFRSSWYQNLRAKCSCMLTGTTLLQSRGYFAQEATPVGRLSEPIAFGLLLGEGGWRAHQAQLYCRLKVSAAQQLHPYDSNHSQSCAWS